MTAHDMLVDERIVRDPTVMAGKPVVKGTRIPVDRVLAHLAHIPDLDDLFAAYPELSLDDVRACFEFARSIVVAQFPHSGDGFAADSSTSAA